MLLFVCIFFATNSLLSHISGWSLSGHLRLSPHTSFLNTPRPSIPPACSVGSRTSCTGDSASHYWLGVDSKTHEGTLVVAGSHTESTGSTGSDCGHAELGVLPSDGSRWGGEDKSQLRTMLQLLKYEVQTSLSTFRLYTCLIVFLL